MNGYERDGLLDRGGCALTSLMKPAAELQLRILQRLRVWRLVSLGRMGAMHPLQAINTKEGSVF